MARTLTIQLRPTKSYSAPSVANLVHASGLAKATYWLKDSNNLTQNIKIKNTREAVSLWRKWTAEATEIVRKNFKKNPRKDQILIEEGLMVIGNNLDKKSKEIYIKIFEDFKKWFETTYDTKIFYYVLHDHEGHETEDGIFENLHIHFLFRNVNSKGYGVRKSLKKGDLSNFQTKIYEIGRKYISDLERAKNYFKEGKKAPRHRSHNEFRQQKRKEQIKALLKTKKNLKEEIEKLRKELIEKNKKLEEIGQVKIYTKEDYNALSTLKKQLKAENVPEILNEFLKLKEELNERYVFYTKDGKKLTRNEVLDILKSKDRALNKASQKQKELLDIIKYLKDENDALKASKSDLEEENKKLKEMLLKNYVAELNCFKCNRVVEHNQYVILKLKKEGLVENYEQKDGKIKIITKEFNLEETENRKGFKVNLKSPKFWEKEIEKAILIVLQLKGWDINDIVPRGSQEFVEKAKKVIEKLKDEIEYKDNLVRKKRKFKF